MTDSSATAMSALRVGAGVALVLCVPFIGMQFSDEVVWSTADFALAGILLATIGVMIELALRRAGSRIAAVGVAALGVVAAIAGEADDAPGLVLFGILLIAGALAVGVRVATGKE